MKTVLPRFADSVVRCPDEFYINCSKICKLSLSVGRFTGEREFEGSISRGRINTVLK